MFEIVYTRTRSEDEWQARARAAGVVEELAVLGRAVIREAYQHDWSGELQRECDWDDDNETMIEFAFHDRSNTDRH